MEILIDQSEPFSDQKIVSQIRLNDLHFSFQFVIPGQIMSARAPPAREETTTEAAFEAVIKVVEMEVEVSEVTEDGARVTWRHFKTEEKRFVDGVQVR